MSTEREEFGPYWPRTAEPFDAQPHPGLPSTSFWPFPRINSALLAAIDWSKVPIPPQAPPWFPPPRTSAPPQVKHLELANYWGAGPTVPAGTVPLSTHGVLGSLGQPQYGVREEPIAPNALDANDLFKSAGIGLARGAIAMPGALGDSRELMANGAQKAADYLAPGSGEAVGHVVSRALGALPFLNGWSSADIQHLIERATGPFYEPKTVAGEYARTAGEFAPGALLPGGILRNTLRYVVPAALASETAGQLTKGSWVEPWARFLATIATGGAAAAASHFPRRAPSIPPAERLPSAQVRPEMPATGMPAPDIPPPQVNDAWAEAPLEMGGDANRPAPGLAHLEPGSPRTPPGARGQLFDDTLDYEPRLSEQFNLPRARPLQDVPDRIRALDNPDTLKRLDAFVKEGLVCNVSVATRSISNHCASTLSESLDSNMAKQCSNN